MDTVQLKHKIIEQILEIEDPKVLNSLNIILNSSSNLINDMATDICEKMQNKDANDVDNYSDYIKEWVKNM